jgi:hypothetical protein
MIFKTVLVSLIFLGITAVIYTFVNIELLRERDVCESNNIDKEVIATVISNSEGRVTYKFSNITCTITLYGGSGLKPGDSAVIFRSDSGRCSVKKQLVLCDIDMFVFNVIFSIFGVPILCGIGVFIHTLIDLDNRVAFEENLEEKVEEKVEEKPKEVSIEISAEVQKN